MKTKWNLGISGRMASGKSTMADYYVNEHGYTKCAFATPMKEMEQIHQEFKRDNKDENWLVDKLTPYVMNLGIDYHIGMHEFIKLYNESPLIVPKNREFLQKIGTEIIRKLNPNAFVEYVLNQVKTIDGPVVVDDIRFTNEANALRENGFFLIRLFNETDARMEKVSELYGEEALKPERVNHVSETQLDFYEDFDIEICNKYDENLLNCAEAILMNLERGR